MNSHFDLIIFFRIDPFYGGAQQELPWGATINHSMMLLEKQRAYRGPMSRPIKFTSG